MPTPPEHQTAKIDALMEEASQALVKRKYFECEQIAAAALRKAHSLDDFERMSRILLPLQEARRLKRQLAVDSGRVTLVNGELPSGKDLVAGCYLILPPRVGVDGRALREYANQNEIPVMVLVREPTTRDGLWPVVSVGPVTVRTKVPPPKPGAVRKKGTKRHDSHAEEQREDAMPTTEWFLETCEAMGDAAIASVPETLPGANRVDMLLERLEALPDHEKLHQKLEEAARDAMREPARKKKPVPEGYMDDGEDDLENEDN